jgi:uncharacterized protein (TIGR02246 family)
VKKRLALLLALVACGGEGAKAPVTATSTATATKSPAAVDSLFAALNAHDAKAAAACYAPGGSMQMAGMPPVSGKDAITAGFEKMFADSPDFAVRASRVLVSGSNVVVQWTFHGTRMGKPSGANGADVMTLDGEGHIAQDHVYFDPATLRAVPPFPAGGPEIVTSAGPAKNVDTVKTFVATMDANRQDDVLAMVTDDLVWDDYSAPGAFSGKADGKKYLEAVASTFSDVKHTINLVFAAGPYVVTEDVVEATHTMSKKPVKGHGVQVMEMADGKIKKAWSYANNLEIAEQLGILRK